MNEMSSASRNRGAEPKHFLGSSLPPWNKIERPLTSPTEYCTRLESQGRFQNDEKWVEAIVP